MSPPRAPGVARRLASAVYDLLLVAALVLIATFPFLAFFGDSTHGWRRHLLQAWVVCVVGAYFVWFWTRGGQTLPMKTWHIRVVRADGQPVGTARAIHRYLIALLGFFAAGLGFAWALVDRDRQFLHDRLAGTALIDAPRWRRGRCRFQSGNTEDTEKNRRHGENQSVSWVRGMDAVSRNSQGL